MSSISLATALPGPKSAALALRKQQAVPRGVPQSTPIYVQSAHGAAITDVDGNVFLDFYGGIGCINAGHTAPEVVAAIQQQAELFLHTCFMVAPYEGYVALAERLNALAPGKTEKRTFFVNSGAEAVENGIKIARSYTGRPAVICFDDAFHGRTLMTMSVTAKEKPYKLGFGPFATDIYRVSFANPYRIPDAANATLAALEETLRTRIPADQVAAILFEPVQGEGGFIVPPIEFVQGLRAIADKYGIVLIADEVQSGFGRTGRMFACEHFDLEPDILLSAKSIASGMPLAAITGKAAIMDQPGPGGIGGTFGGNPVSCAAALATLDVFEKYDLLARSRAIGAKFTERAHAWQKRFPVVGDVRGLGGMCAIELVLDRADKTPAGDLTKKVAHYALEHGVLLVTAGTYGNVIRILVPLAVTDEQFDEGLDVIEAALTALA
jgi:4-aminobutyrate aminotransferase / (S)-3-amino-2-methylpropionate transaminase / 5-aminovalerate transaminase